MELKEFLNVFRRKKKVFFGVLFGFVFIAFLVFLLQPNRFEGEAMINVTRNGIQETSDYRYDDFYRLQADERFADTIVRWMESPTILKSITTEDNVKISAQRLSSQVIQVKIISSENENIPKIVEKIENSVNNQIEMLNNKQSDENWFAIYVNEPVISSGKIFFSYAIGIGIALGIFVGFWSVLIVYYAEKK